MTKRHLRYLSLSGIVLNSNDNPVLSSNQPFHSQNYLFHLLPCAFLFSTVTWFWASTPCTPSTPHSIYGTWLGVAGDYLFIFSITGATIIFSFRVITLSFSFLGSTIACYCTVSPWVPWTPVSSNFKKVY